MNKMKKIKYVAAVIIMLFICFISINSNAENYYEMYTEKKNEFMKRSDLGTIIGTPSSPKKFSDYGYYVCRYGGIWCTSENEENNGNTLKIQDIVDLNANGSIKSMKSGKTNSDNKYQAGRAAYIINYWQSQVSNSTYKYNGWKFYNLPVRDGVWKYISNYVDTTKAIDDMFDPNGGKLENGLPEDVKKGAVNYGKLVRKDHRLKCTDQTAYLYTSETSDFKSGGDGLKWKTKITGYNINSDSLELGNDRVDVSIEIAGKKYNIKKSGDYYYLYSGSTKAGRYVVSTSNIYLSDTITECGTIKITKKVKGIRARVILLGGTAVQTRGIARATEETNTYSLEIKAPICKVDVSLQKYISKVQSNGTVTNMLERKDRTPYDGNKNKINKIQGLINDAVAGRKYKCDDVVIIEAGDYVTYTINVYNNSSTNATTVSIEDTLPSYIDSNISVEGNKISGWQKNGNNLIINVSNLSGGEHIETYVTVRFNAYSGQTLENKATIKSTAPRNETECRITDSDYIKMKKYEVKLEKSICKVSAENGYMGDIYNSSRYNNIKNYADGKNRVDYDNIVKHLRIKADIDKSGSLDANDLEILSTYLQIKDKNIDVNETNVESWNKLYDLNDDNNINIEDKYIYNIIKNGLINTYKDSINEIGSYIKADINEDGIVDQKDINIFKILSMDIDGNGIIDNDDMLILKLSGFDFNKNEKINNEDLAILKTLYIKQNYNDGDIINSYIKSDINNDGIVNSKDMNEFNHIKQLYKNITDANERLERLSKNFDKYDLNNDGIISKSDSNIISEWIKGSYSKCSALNETEVTGQINGKNKENISVDSISEIYDNLIGKKYDEEYDYFKDDTEEEEITSYDKTMAIEEVYKIHINEISKLQEANQYDEKYDLNSDGKSDDKDIDILSAFSVIDKSKINDDILDTNGDGEININDIEETKVLDDGSEEKFIIPNKVDKFIKENNMNSKDNVALDSKILNSYDINNDGKIDVEDYNYIYNYMKAEKPYNEKYDLNNDGTLNQEDSQIIYDFIEFQKNDEYIDETDYTILKVIISEKEYNKEFEDLNTILDINFDGRVDEQDKQEYDKNIINYKDIVIEKSTQNKETINEMYNLISQYSEIDINKIKEKINKDGLDKTISYINSGKNDENDEDYTKYDFNNDNIVDNTDLKILNLFYLSDLNKDGSVDYNDMKIAKEFKKYITEINNEEEIKEILAKYSKNKPDIKLEQIEQNLNQQDKYDLNEDKKVNDNDLNILIKNQKIQSRDISNINLRELTNIIGIDVNKDGFTNDEDLKIIKVYNEYSNTKDDNGYQRLDINEDGNINQKDYELLREIIITQRDSLASIKYSLEGKTASDVGVQNYYREEENGKGYCPLYKDSKNMKKYNDVVEVNENDTIRYKIKVTNIGENNDYWGDVYVTQILDVLKRSYNNSDNILINRNQNDISGERLSPGASTVFYIDYKVRDKNILLDLYTNTAKITEIKNKNNVNVTDADNQENNEDSDYFQLKDIPIKGMVWNDVNKTKDGQYDSIYNSTEEKIGGIKVSLCRIKNGTGTVLKTKETMEKTGEYTFTYNDIEKVSDNEKFIKASKNSGNNRWNSYYNYYIVFTYDGITYTSTPDGNTYRKISDDYQGVGKGNYRINSNACEKEEERIKFNNKFSTINNSSDIKYTTKNEDGYIPQSNHIYNEETMSIQSSTELITFKNDEKLEEQLKYVNLGLRGKDVFDLELTSNVSKVQVTVNNKVGVYNYTNKINIRNTDVGQSEDMANVESETASQYLYDSNKNEVKQEQALRDTDLNTSSAYTGTNEISYSKEQGIQDIQVTYKVTVTNASQTDGIATSIINYYDKAYVVEKDNLNAYIEMNGKKISNLTYTNYENISILKFDMENAVGNSNLKQSESYNLYYTLTMTSNTITKLKDYMQANESNEKVGKLIYPTYNMSEIFEYKTKAGTGQTEYTRGLLDKDSAPGSIAKEQVRLTTTINQTTPTENGTPSTLTYYTNGKELEKLKYEDDTCTTPTLYFVSQNTTDSGKGRKISGTVFEDYTAIIDNNDGSEIRTKTGDGIQTGDEPGIEGVIVELREKTGNGNTEDDYTTRYEVESDENGHFEFKNFLPGNYKIRYTFGTTRKNESKDESEKQYKRNIRIFK